MPEDVDYADRFRRIERALDMPNKTVRGVALALGEQLVKACPEIVKKVMNADDRERLREMVKLARSVQAGDVAEHDASVSVGQALVDDFVKKK
jgi:hypothetical protein